MKVLLDTCVLTELRRAEQGHPGVLAAVAEIPDSEIYLSVLMTRNTKHFDASAAHILDPWRGS